MERCRIKTVNNSEYILEKIKHFIKPDEWFIESEKPKEFVGKRFVSMITDDAKDRKAFEKMCQDGHANHRLMKTCVKTYDYPQRGCFIIFQGGITEEIVKVEKIQ